MNAENNDWHERHCGAGLGTMFYTVHLFRVDCEGSIQDTMTGESFHEHLCPPCFMFVCCQVDF